MTGRFDVVLDGVRPEPLGSYLKALAVLRLVSEQKDAHAAGYWQDDVFHLVSKLDAEGLLRFFAEEYAPTPIVGPWGARSGFFAGSSEASARAALGAIVDSASPRLAAFRDVVLAVRRVLERKGLSEKAKDEEKVELLADLRNELPDAALPWLDAAYVLGTRDANGQLSRAFPPILGTGGNEGSQGYSSTFMQALVDVGLLAGVARAPASALFGLPESGLTTMATGQYVPGSAGGFNQGHGFAGDATPMSAWELVLLFEGAATWISGPSTRHGTRAVGRESSPFTVRQLSVDGSAAGGEEEKARAELWAPLWERPARWSEIAALLAEGRMHVGRRPARDTLEMARAARSLGVDRGITSFIRYPILVRNGKNYFAFAIGRFGTGQRAEAELVGSLEAPLGYLDAAIRREKNPPPRIIAARRVVSQAMFEVLRGSDSARSALWLMRAVGRLDTEVASWTVGRELRPLSGLSAEWLAQVRPTPEVRIAAAIASIRPRRGAGPFRSNLVGVDAAQPMMWADGAGQSAWRGPTLSHRLASVLSRRLLDAARPQELSEAPDDEERFGNPLQGVVTTDVGDAVTYIEGAVADAELEELIHAFTWIDWNDPDTQRVVRGLRWRAPELPAPRAYSLLKLCFWPSKLPKKPASSGTESAHVVPEPALVPLLMARRIADACHVAQRRLRAHGLAPIDVGSSLQALREMPVDPIRLAASLIIPLSSRAAREELIRDVTFPEREERL